MRYYADDCHTNGFFYPETQAEEAEAARLNASYPDVPLAPAKRIPSDASRLAALLLLLFATSVSYACGTFVYLQVLSLPLAVFCTFIVAAPCVLVGEALADPWTAIYRGGPSRWIARRIWP